MRRRPWQSTAGLACACSRARGELFTVFLRGIALALLLAGCRVRVPVGRSDGWACAARTAAQAEEPARLRVVVRAPAFLNWQWSRDGAHLFLPADDEMLVLDSQTGASVTRIVRRAQGSSAELDRDVTGELNRASHKLVVSVPRDGARELSVYDVPSGALLKTYRGYSWSFSGDGSRLVLHLVGDANPDEARAQIVDGCSLRPLETIAEPGPAQHHGAQGEWVLDDGVTLGVVWRSGVSFINLMSGRTKQVAFGHELRMTPGFWSERNRVAWRVGEQVSVWDGDTEHLSVFNAPGCSATSVATLSPDAQRVALGCSHAIEVWDVASHQRLARIALASAPEDIQWLAGGRGLAVQIAPNEVEHLVLDLATQKPIALARRGERVENIGPKSGLVTISPVGDAAARPHALYLDAALTVHDVANCVLAGYEVAENPGGVGAVDCVGAHGRRAVVLDPKTFKTHDFPVGGRELAIHGDTLASLGPTLELYRLADGARLGGAAVAPAQISQDSWWDGNTLVAPLVGSATARVSLFGDALRVESEALHINAACLGPDTSFRGPLRWNMDPPYTLCDRRSGQALGNVPADVANAVSGLIGTADLDVNAHFVLVSDGPPRLFRRGTWQAVPWEDPPQDARLVGDQLVAGHDPQGQVGVWSADTGKRLAHWPKDKTPGYDPATGYQTGAPNLPLAADLDAGVLVIGSAGGDQSSPAVYDLRSGASLGFVPLFTKGEVRFIAPGVLSVVEPARVSFWRLPQLQRLGVWLTHPSRAQAVFLAASGQLEVTGQLTDWRDVLRCERGNLEMPLETCANARLEPGLAQRTLGLAARK